MTSSINCLACIATNKGPEKKKRRKKHGKDRLYKQLCEKYHGMTGRKKAFLIFSRFDFTVPINMNGLSERQTLEDLKGYKKIAV